MLRPIAVLFLMAATTFAQDLKDVPDVAEQEILRRGNFVERIDGYRNDVTDLIAEALRPPEDDSYKWFISVVTTRNCQYCETLKRDFASSPYLQPYVDTDDHDRSWAHFNVYSAGDETQAWRWDGIQLGGYPTLLIQPPRDGRYGDAKTVVFQKTGYDGDPQKLGSDIRNAIVRYVANYNQQPRRATGIGQAGEPNEQEAQRYEPPFSPPPRVQPTPYVVPPAYPTNFPPVPQPQLQPTINPLSLLGNLLGATMGSGGLTNVLLLVLAAFALIRTFRKATGQKLLLDDAAYQNVVETLKKLIDPKPPNTPNAT
jgi:hypothetical protein